MELQERIQQLEVHQAAQTQRLNELRQHSRLPLHSQRRHRREPSSPGSPISPYTHSAPSPPEDRSQQHKRQAREGHRRWAAQRPPPQRAPAIGAPGLWRKASAPALRRAHSGAGGTQPMQRGAGSAGAPTQEWVMHEAPTLRRHHTELPRKGGAAVGAPQASARGLKLRDFERGRGAQITASRHSATEHRDPVTGPSRAVSVRILERGTSPLSLHHNASFCHGRI